METINNNFYHSLGDDWYQKSDHPIALLRAEAKLLNQWVQETIVKNSSSPLVASQHRILDIGCGAGFYSNFFARKGLKVTGLDLSRPSLDVARSNDETGTVEYVEGNAQRLPFDDAAFDSVTIMDVLEHVDDPCGAIAEASRVLKIGGTLFFHTINRTFLSWLVALRGVEWLVPNTPKNIHVYHMFIKPKELQEWCYGAALDVEFITGMRPVLKRNLLRGIVERKVPEDFSFQFTGSKQITYVGYAKKKNEPWFDQRTPAFLA